MNNITSKENLTLIEISSFDKLCIKNKIKLGDKIIINRTNGDIYRENTNESTCFIKKEKISF